MKNLSFILLILSSMPAMAGTCKLTNNVSKQNGELTYHNTSKARIFETDILGCLELIQTNYMSIEHQLQKGYSYAGSGATYFDTDTSGIKDKESFYLRASNITEPRANICEGVYSKEKKFFRSPPTPIKIISPIVKVDGLSDVEECFAKNSETYLQAIDNGKYEGLIVYTTLKSNSGAPFEVVIYGHKNTPAFKRTMEPIIQKLNQ